MDEALKEKRLLWKRTVELGVSLTLVHIAAVVSGWYHAYPWIDIPQHFLGGVLAALVFYWINFSHPQFFRLIPGAPISLLLVLSWTALSGVLFEFAEFFYDAFFFGYLKIGSFPSQLGLKDTMGDLLLDILGGLSLAIFMRLRYDRRKRQM